VDVPRRHGGLKKYQGEGVGCRAEGVRNKSELSKTAVPRKKILQKGAPEEQTLSDDFQVGSNESGPEAGVKEGKSRRSYCRKKL